MHKKNGYHYNFFVFVFYIAYDFVLYTKNQREMTWSRVYIMHILYAKKRERHAPVVDVTPYTSNGIISKQHHPIITVIIVSQWISLINPVTMTNPLFFFFFFLLVKKKKSAGSSKIIFIYFIIVNKKNYTKTKTNLLGFFFNFTSFINRTLHILIFYYNY